MRRTWSQAIASAPAALMCASLAAGPAAALSTPPMGWNSWNHFAAKIDDATVRAQADAMVKSGMRDAGYVYVNIDDGWQGERDATGAIHPNARFPDMKALADYIHARGLKLGLYSSPGPTTCANFVGSYGHEVQDAQTYAAWGIDYLKYDLCSLSAQVIGRASPEQGQAVELAAYRNMSAALSDTHRPIVFSICQYGFNAPWRWGASVSGDLWRTTGDINDSYGRMAELGFGQAGLSRFQTPGHWNDPDMLEVGNGGMNAEEYRTHMSLWALLAAPLIAGNDLTAMTPQTLTILTNPRVVAVDQDAAGRQGERVSAEGPLEVWARPLADGGQAVGLFNRSDFPAYVEVDFRALGVLGPAAVQDVWSGEHLGALERYRALTPAHGVVMLRLRSIDRKLR